jgi:hypothetical protein
MRALEKLFALASVVRGRVEQTSREPRQPGWWEGPLDDMSSEQREKGNLNDRLSLLGRTHDL